MSGSCDHGDEGTCSLLLLNHFQSPTLNLQACSLSQRYIEEFKVHDLTASAGLALIMKSHALNCLPFDVSLRLTLFFLVDDVIALSMVSMAKYLIIPRTEKIPCPSMLGYLSRSGRILLALSMKTVFLFRFQASNAQMSSTSRNLKPPLSRRLDPKS